MHASRGLLFGQVSYLHHPEPLPLSLYQLLAFKLIKGDCGTSIHILRIIIYHFMCVLQAEDPNWRHQIVPTGDVVSMRTWLLFRKNWCSATELWRSGSFSFTWLSGWVGSGVTQCFYWIYRVTDEWIGVWICVDSFIFPNVFTNLTTHLFYLAIVVYEHFRIPQDVWNYIFEGVH